MELTINGKEYSFKFGVKFVRELDKTVKIEREGISFGMGLAAKVLPELMTGNINTLSNVLFLANRTETPKLSQNEIDDYIDDCEDIEALFDLVTDELKESNAGKLAMKNLNIQKTEEAEV